MPGTREQALKRWSNPEYRAKQLRSKRDPSRRARHSKLMKANWAARTSEERKVRTAAMQKAQQLAWKQMSDKERVAKMKRSGKGNNKRWADPEYRAAMVVKRKATGQRKDIKVKLSANGKKAWANKASRAKLLKDRAGRKHNWRMKQKISAAVQAHYDKGNSSWNKGLTKETSKVLARVSKNLQGTIPAPRKKCWYINRKTGERIAMRSGWEVKFKKWCLANKIPVEYERRYFNIGRGKYIGTSYTPDFYFPRTKVYAEIKGWYKVADQNKIAKFKLECPKVKLLFIDGSCLKAMGVL